MSVLLFVVGALALMGGAAMIGFGIPINEFSFGNTLIIAGMSAAIGGLIIIGLGAVVAQLRRIAEGQAVRPPVRAPSRAPDVFEAPAGPPAARVPFPPKPPPGSRVETRATVARGAELPAEEPPPFLRNPSLPPVPSDERVSLSPGEPLLPPEPGTAEPERIEPVLRTGEDTAERFDSENEDGRREPFVESVRRSSSYFDTMWPAPEPKPDKPAQADETPGDTDAGRGRENTALRRDDEPEVAPLPEPNQESTVAVLKSGVVDGMGYTLYVDGSIEAELPQGTLRFASIDDLRSYLEKNA